MKTHNMERTPEFNNWLLKHKNVTMEKFNNLGLVMQEEVYQVYLNEKKIKEIINY